MAANGTQKGDVYSFAIIAQEVVYRRGPFYIPNSHFSAEGTTILSTPSLNNPFSVIKATLGHIKKTASDGHL